MQAKKHIPDPLSVIKIITCLRFIVEFEQRLIYHLHNNSQSIKYCQKPKAPQKIPKT